jgi:hypothetical protein
MMFQRILYSFVLILITLQSSHLIAQSAVYIPCMQDTTKVLSLTITQPVCGNNTGSIHVVTNNNQTLYGYLLTDSLNNFQVINGTFNDEFTINNIPIGNYFLTVGCDSTKLYTYPDTIKILPSTPPLYRLHPQPCNHSQWKQRLCKHLYHIGHPPVPNRNKQPKCPNNPLRKHTHLPR